VGVGEGVGVGSGVSRGVGVCKIGDSVGEGCGDRSPLRNEPTNAQEPKPARITKPAPSPIAVMGLSQIEPVPGSIAGSGWFGEWALWAIGSGRRPTATVATCEIFAGAGAWDGGGAV
jgi:hypothetical protein